ncbi:Guanine nucleotide-binding protein-like 1 [Lonchura striata]|uniref:Guanine nucleotide-binding protein-like 1 n=1 Tax=Lonchura striata TaxID=40157 RepID=A0A218U7G5_9PASE|nr:Guanine nucleotide-binding protein-like 1 [Lonchura striata domestica]
MSPCPPGPGSALSVPSCPPRPLMFPPVPSCPLMSPGPQALGVPPALAAHVSQDLAKGLILILNKVDLVPPAVATAWSHLLRARHGAARVRPPRPGLPNAGKSSVLNALLGRGAVGVSRAPGRTRYFQTHFLTGSVRLCDCPGLVFPSRAPPELQVLAGVYPIAQLQDPYSAVGFLGSHLALPPLLQLRPPSGGAWTAWELCEAWAEKRGYKTARAARNDVARAANGLLRLAAEGRLRLCFRPPGYSREKERWELHPDTAALAAMTGGGACAPDPAPSSEDEGAGSDQATPPPSPAPNPFALLGEDESWQGCTPFSLLSQVLAGVYPIAQLQDPYSAVGFLGSHLALPPLLQLRPPSGGAWTAWELCEGGTEHSGMFRNIPKYSRIYLHNVPGSCAKPGQRRGATRRRGRRATTWRARPTGSCGWRPRGGCASASGPRATPGKKSVGSSTPTPRRWRP